MICCLNQDNILYLSSTNGKKASVSQRKLSRSNFYLAAECYSKRVDFVDLLISGGFTTDITISVFVDLNYTSIISLTCKNWQFCNWKVDPICTFGVKSLFTMSAFGSTDIKQVVGLTQNSCWTRIDSLDWILFIYSNQNQITIYTTRV